jgi:nucleotide-binding universal stress UspA family protein
MRRSGVVLDGGGNMYETILLPIDGSEPSCQAEDTALDLAERFDAELHALHVVDTRHHSEPALSATELLTDEAEEEARALLERVTERGESRGIEVETRCCHGTPHREIIRYAEETDAGLIVLGCRGHTHEEKLGRVANRVVRDAGQETLAV